MKILYKSSNYNKDDVIKTYVRKCPLDEVFTVYEVNADGLTIREYIKNPDNIPESIKIKAEEQRHRAFGCVELC